MGGFSIWHWLVLAIIFGVPVLILYYAVRAGVRAGLRDSRRDRSSESDPPA